jgi:hypothetical protein
MLHKTFSYEGLEPKDRAIIADSTELVKIRSYAKELTPNVLNFDTSGAILSNYPVLSGIDVRGIHHNFESLRGVILNYPNLKFLSLPLELIDVINCRLPNSLETIAINGVGRTALPKNIQSENLRRLIGSWPVSVTFKHASVPSITCFYCRTLPKTNVLAEIAKYSKIEVLTVSDHPKMGGLFLPERNSVRFLRLIDNGLEALNDVPVHEGVTDLYLHSENRLGTLDGIQAFGNLRELSILYCGRLRNIDALLSTNIKVLSIVGCALLEKTRVVEKIAPLKLQSTTLNI